MEQVEAQGPRERVECQVQLAQLVRRELVVLLERVGHQALPELLEAQDPLVPMGHQEHQVLVEYQVFREQVEARVLPDQLEVQEVVARQVRQVRLEYLEVADHPERLERWE